MKKLTMLFTSACALTFINTSFGMLTKTSRTIATHKNIKSLYPNIPNHQYRGVILSEDYDEDFCPCNNHWIQCPHREDVLCPDLLKKKNNILLCNRIMKIRDILKYNNFNNKLEELWNEDRDCTQYEIEDALQNLDRRNDDIIDLLSKDISDIKKQIKILREQHYLTHYLEVHKIHKIEKGLYKTFDIKEDNE